MGWAAEDKPTVEEAKVRTALSRKEAYRLIQKLEEIKHIEKKPVLLKLGQQLYDTLNQIDFQLSR